MAGGLAAADAPAELRARRSALGQKALAAMGEKKFQQAIELLRQSNAIQKQLKEETHPTTALNHLQLGVAHQRLGQLRLARGAHETSLAIARDCLRAKIRVPTGIITANWLALSRLHSRLGQYARAATYLEQYRRLKIKAGDESPVTRLTTNGKLADLYLDLRQYQKALALLLLDLKLARKTWPADSLNQCKFNLRLAEILLKLGRHDEAGVFLQQANATLRARPQVGPLHILGLNQQADLLLARGNEATVPKLLDLALKFAGKIHGPQSNAYAEQLIRQGRFFMSRGQLAKARANFESALAITRKNVDAIHPRTAQMLADLAHLEAQLGDTASAVRKYQLSIDIYSQTVGRDSPSLCAPLQQLALIDLRQGNYPAAQARLARALAIAEKSLGPNHQETAVLLASLGHLKLVMLDLQASAQLLERSLQLHLEIFGPTHRQTLGVRGERALLHEIFHEHQKAHAEYKLIHQAHSENDATHSLLAIRNLMRLARTLDQLGEDQRAGTRFEAALAAVKKSLGPRHRETAVVLSHQAHHHARHHRLDDALKLQQQSLDLMRQLKLDNDPFYFISLGHLAEYQQAHGQTAKAVNTLAQLLQRQHLLGPQILGKLTEPDALTFLRGQQFLTTQIETTIAAATGQPAALRLGAEHLALSKARLEEIRWAQSRVQSNSTGELSTQRERVAHLRAQLLYQRQPARVIPPAESLQAQAELRQAEAALAGLILKTDHAVARHLSGTRPTLEQIARQLPEGSALIDVVGYRQPAAGNVKAHQRYAAYLTFASAAGNPKVKRIDLGPARELNTAITELHRLMYRGLVAEPRLEPVIAKLSQALGAPLQKALGDTRQLFICPDSHLARLPFELLKTGDKYWLEKYQISYLGSAREILRLRQPRPKAPANPAVIVGAPKFTASPQPGSQRGGPFRPLKFSAKEIDVIARALGKDTQQLTGDRATEAALMKIKQPRVLHLSTHAYYLHDTNATGRNRALLNEAPANLRPVRLNPLLRCGLALTGANDPRPDGGAAGDGLLSGWEASQLNLHGTELVILSACESAVGEIHSGEGTLSLRRAFRVAGAEAVLASHWPVSDRATGELMRRFIVHWQGGKPRAEALRAAQRELRADEDLDSPYFWAAFTLMGQWR